MHVHFVSDIHLESGAFHLDPPDIADAVVIAGDLGPGYVALSWLEENAPRIRQPIVYVPGNHCFWHSDFDKWNAHMKKACLDLGVYWLYNEVVELADAVILGTTLWTDLNLHGNQPLKLAQAGGMMNDYLHMRRGDRNIRPDEILAEHHKARGFLDTQLRVHAGRKRLVVTHHAPTERSLQQRDSRYAPFYASDLRHLIHEHQPDVWFHGHVHSSVQYFEGETMVATNPRGHIDSAAPHMNPNFNPHYLLEF